MENQEIVISHYLTPIRTKTLNSGPLPSFCTFELPYSKSELITAEEGQVLVQSISHYIANIQLSEYQMNQDVSIDLQVKQPAFLMFIMLNGKSILYDKANRIVSESLGNCSTLIHMTPGKYRRTLLKGNHKILVITFREDWFLSKTMDMEEMAPIRENHLTEEKPYYALPHCAISDGILGLLEGFRNDKYIDDNNISGKIFTFVDACISRYHKKLMAEGYDTNTINKRRASEIVNFVKENFTSKSVEDATLLAKHFNVSEKNLTRLVKKGFGRPLHEQVTYLRMHYGLKMLLTTTKPVNEVAIMMGYSDPLYFSKVFKRYHKVSPSEVHRLCL